MACVLMLLLANLSVARAAIACGNESEHRAVEAAPADAHAHHAAAEPGDDATRDDSGSSADTPLCCQALATCTVNGDAAAERIAFVGMDRATLVDAARNELPPSRIQSPEPPPPRV